ncbi:neprilysin-2 [Drosophila mauritiana]|uniref:Neprilysin-2 n=1 Tax=Drosophila mauritiana TaxID=7226 RepID=A0A6P8KDH6_DROMA|nr:neprilysin-2 [Drosophila mauritiana]
MFPGSLKLISLMLLWVIVAAVLTDCEARSFVDRSDNSDSNGSPTNRSTAEYQLREYAEFMKSYMNQSVAPCENFYEYACGNYRNVKPDRYSPSSRSNLGDVAYTLIDITEQLVGRMDLAEALNVSSELAVAQRFYNACLGANLHPFNAADPAYLSLIRSIGGFPAVDGDAWNASNFNWINMSAHLANFGANGLIREALQLRYPFEPYTKLPELGFDHIIVHEENISSNTTRAFRLNEERMHGYLRAFGLPEDRIRKAIAGVFAFWRDALEIPPQCEVFDPYRIEREFPQSEYYYNISWSGLHSSNKLFCDFYYVELDKVCARHREAVANYLAMKLLYRFDPKLKAPRYQRNYCAVTLYHSMRFLFNKLYMANNFSEEKKLEMSEMVRELRKSLRKTLADAEWLDAKSRARALLKESRIQSRIGSFQDDALSDRIIREINSLKVIGDSYAETNINLQNLVVQINRFSSRHFQELTEDTKPQKILTGLQVGAGYYTPDNSINVMAGVVEPPIYHRHLPLSLKFGTLGFIVGHELIHGFDTTSSYFNGNGQLEPLLSELSQQSLEDRAECYMDYYGKYQVPQISRRVNGKTTLDENIADNSGLRQALSAYRSHRQQLLEHPGQERISDGMPGLDLAPEQLFFLGFAQLFCSHYEEEHYWKGLSDEHTFDQFRVLGVLSNSEDFFHAYNCSVGSGMRPGDKTCRLW